MYKGHSRDSRPIYDFCKGLVVNPHVVVDLGAHQGAGYQQLRMTYPNAVIHLVEPIEDCVACLRQVTAGDQNTVIHPYAVGKFERDEMINTFSSDNRQSSNLYSNRGGAYGQAVPVPIHVMSYRDLPEKIDLAKINIEAGEFELLETDFFDRVGAFVMEAHNSLVPEKTWKDVIDTLQDAFDLKTFGDLNYKYCFITRVKI